MRSRRPAWRIGKRTLFDGALPNIVKRMMKGVMAKSNEITTMQIINPFLHERDISKLGC